MRIQRHYYDSLKQIRENAGGTMGVLMKTLDEMLAHGLIEPERPRGTEYRFRLTPRGLAGLEDRPLSNVVTRGGGRDE